MLGNLQIANTFKKVKIKFVVRLWGYKKVLCNLDGKGLLLTLAGQVTIYCYYLPSHNNDSLKVLLCPTTPDSLLAGTPYSCHLHIVKRFPFDIKTYPVNRYEQRN